MFISSAELAFLRGQIKQLGRAIDGLREDIRRNPSADVVIQWNDALESDLRAEITRLADALGYEVVVYGARYEKKGAKKAK